MSCDKSHLILNPIGQLQAVSIIYSRTFYIGKHMNHRRVYLWLLDFVCTFFRCLIYFLQSVCISFRLFRVPVNFIFWSVRFRKSFNEMILWSTSEARIWFLTITLITLIVRFPCIKGWFLIAFLLFLFSKAFFSWVYTSTVNAPWLSK